MDLDLEKLVLPEHVGALLLIALQLLLKLLNLHSEIINHASVVIRAAALRGKIARRYLAREGIRLNILVR